MLLSKSGFLSINQLCVLKTGWVTALNSAISKVLSARYSKMAPIHDRRMSPSLVRHTSHTFVRRPDLLGGAYTGTWLNAEPHGQYVLFLCSPHAGFRLFSLHHFLCFAFFATFHWCCCGPVTWRLTLNLLGGRFALTLVTILW